MGKRGTGRPYSIRSRLRAVTALEAAICTLLFVFLAFSRLSDAYSGYNQRSAQTAVAFAAQVFGETDGAVSLSKFPGKITNSTINQTFIAKALRRGGIRENTAFRSELYNNFKSLMDQSAYLTLLAIYDEDGAGVFVRRDADSYYLTKTAADAPFLTQARARRGGETVLGTDDPGRAGLPAVLLDRCVTVTRAVFDPLQMRTLGVFVLALDVDGFSRTFTGLRANPRQQYALYREGALLAGDFADAPFADAEVRRGDVATRLASSGGATYLYCAYRYDATKTLLLRTPLAVVVSGVLKLNLALLAALTAALSLIALVIRRMMRSVLDPLGCMTETFDRTRDGCFPPLPAGEVPEDLRPLFDAYGRLSARIDLLVNEGLRKDVEKREIELQFLRTQINPHYLYNTLECIHLQAYSAGDMAVANMAELLGRNLQYGLHEPNARVTLRTECDKAREYMRLVAFHYGDRVRLRVMVDGAVMDCLVIKMILQPLIENAIQHGLSPDRPLNIELLGYRDGETLILQVTDDGRGISPAAIDQLRAQMEDDTARDAIGLRNVSRRLRLHYGPGYGVTVRSLEGESTVVILTLPAQTEGEDANEAARNPG